VDDVKLLVAIHSVVRKTLQLLEHVDRATDQHVPAIAVFFAPPNE
jgi:hypothetical protein